MAFNDLQLKVAAEAASVSLHKNLAKLSLFAKSYSELQGQYGNAVAVPVIDLSAAGDFDADSNNYGSGTNEVGGALVTLDKHTVKSISITDPQLAETGINWIKDTTTAMVDSIGRSVNNYVMGLLNDTNITLSATCDVSTKAKIADLYTIAEENDIPFDKAVIALAPAEYA